jgi:hypothetical protein
VEARGAGGSRRRLRLVEDILGAELARRPIRDQPLEKRLRRESPFVADEGIDFSNCVLNLMRPEDRRQLLAEVFRVLRRGGRAVVSDIASPRRIM